MVFGISECTSLSPRRIFTHIFIQISPVTLLWLFHSNFLTETTLHFPTKVCFTFRITVSSTCGNRLLAKKKTCGNRFESTCMKIGHVFDILTVLLHSCVKNCSYTVGDWSDLQMQPSVLVISVCYVVRSLDNLRRYMYIACVLLSSIMHVLTCFHRCMSSKHFLI